MKCHRFKSLSGLWLVVLALTRPEAQADQALYTDALQNAWQNWSWGSTVNYNNSSPVHGGSKSIAVTITNAWSAFYLHHTVFDSSGYSNLSFWIQGGSAGGQQLQVQAILNTTNPQPAVILAPLVANSWQQITISLAALNAANRTDLDGIWIQDRIGSAQPIFYVDDLALTTGATPPVTNAAVPILINALLDRHAISPLVYGTCFASSNQLSDLNCPLNRSGGNAETRYNWQLNARNHAADWYFESLADNSALPGAAVDQFVADSKNGGGQAMITIPMIGWMPKLGPGRQRLSSFSIAKYGLQADHDWQWFADAGNGIVTNTTTVIATNDPTDAHFLTNSVFQQSFVQYLTNRWGSSSNGGVRYYIMDNEHTLWHGTHRDVHPVGTTMKEIRDKFFDYAGKVKGVDPGALVVAPEEWGWSGYLYSGYDQQWSGANQDWSPAHFPDRATNGGWDYMPWFLDQARQRATNTNQRLLDYFTLHIYPQGGEYGNDVSSTMQALRNRSTRSLWDTNYVDPTWINSVVKLIPRMKAWVASFYPGTKIGITEYSWGAENHINGATAQADILGIFGREGLDLATRWGTPDASTPTYKAMKLYRNYDNNHSGFGETSIAATTSNPDNVAAFAAVRSADGALTAMVINKQLSAGAAVSLSLSNFVPTGVGQRWQLTSANVISHLSDVSFAGNIFTNTVPAQSVTLFVFPAVVAPQLRSATMSPSNTFSFWLDGQAGQRYVIQGTTNFISWLPVLTNTLTSNSVPVVVGSTNFAYRFYRAQWLP